MSLTNDLESSPPPPEPSTPIHETKVPTATSSDGSSVHSRVEGIHILGQKQDRQKLLFTDPVAFQYLAEDPSTVVLDRRCALQGYEIYIVEQWACSRIDPTFVINTYTGDPSHTAIVGILGVPTDESTWSPRLKVYLNAMAQFHARKRETPLGILMVTNLSSFPSALTVIAVPDGDIRKTRDDFIVNENLKRLGCAGRAGLNLMRPTPATQAKFHQLYRTDERIPFYSAVMELVKQCQIALTVFNKLAPEYVDGLLCDVTESAINDWWTDIGTDFFNIEPSDGILGPTTVAAILGMLMGARNRLSASGAPVSKDVCDLPNLKRGIGSFQKSQKLERSRRLDRQTLDRLHRVTAKAASSEGWTVPRAVKSTVAELGGKGGEMVMGIVAGRDKAGIAAVETLDMDRFVQLVNGERAKWLWHGKPRKTGSDLFREGHGDGDMVFAKDHHGGFAWTSRRRDGGSSGRPSLETEPSMRPTEPLSGLDDREQQAKSIKRSVTDKVSDAKAGLGRLRDAVGLPGIRSHHHKRSKEGVDLESDLSYQPTPESVASLPTPWRLNEPISALDIERIPSTEENQRDDRDDKLPNQEIIEAEAGSSQDASKPHIDLLSDTKEPHMMPAKNVDLRKARIQPSSRRRDYRHERRSRAKRPEPSYIHRPRSCQGLPTEPTAVENDSRWPRHLSFSCVEETILIWKDIGGSYVESADASPAQAMLNEDIIASEVGIFGDKISDLSQRTAPWVQEQVCAVEAIDCRAHARLEELNSVYHEKLEEYHSLRAESVDLIAREGNSLLDSSKKVELLGAKLDYELNVLQSTVEEVEEGLLEFERHIVQIERRVGDLVKDENKNSESSWFGWAGGLFGRKTSES
ncbi:hypothetical protein AJ80_06522 [Polytolypa hystricis UAMH7299]|uniref:STB6-like N-terminal domain-containing protein n=1 Tax=Polytolypa hystricis (strain UAMH7299) TaxID=1447883 RepID=A0A2B7XWN1_POLH7|nr:hypothetical protein AJ80_06522 [Polytolypa hystricis UAMH7299]